MMRVEVVILAVISAGLGAKAMAQGVCQDAYRVPPFEQQSVDRMSADVKAIHDYWINGPYSPDQNIVERNKRVRQLFANVIAIRTAEYAAYRVTCQGEKKVSSSTGNARKSWAHVSFPDETVIVPGTVVQFGKGHRVRPRVSDRRIDYQIGKAGRGSNRGGVRGTASYPAEASARLTKRDLDRVRMKLAAANLPDDTVRDPT
jgi:hypothetical protein